MPSTKMAHMCRAMAENGNFDPELCPLLRDLNPEKIRIAMTENPHIRACAEAAEDRTLDAESRMEVCRASIQALNA